MKQHVRSLQWTNKKKSTSLLIPVLSGFLTVGCSTTPQSNQVPHQKGSLHHTPNTAQPQASQQNVAMDSNTGNTDDSTDDENTQEGLLQATNKQFSQQTSAELKRYGNLWKRMRAGFQLDLSQENYRIDEQKGWFITRQTYIDRLTARASYYLYHTVTEAERRGIPTELALLPVIESSYDPNATSNASAAGMWQFIPSTGRIYGLRQTEGYDGRRDVIESTRAAYDFLTSLYNKFGTWELALAAYNAGPGRVQKAIDANIDNGLATDFWSLDLPNETMKYVPRFLAVAKIVQQPSQYGMSLKSIANRPHFRSVPVQAGVSLAEVSQLTGIAPDEIYDLNAAFISGSTDAAGPNRLLVPVRVEKSFDKTIASLGVSDVNAINAETVDTNSANAVSTSTANTVNTDNVIASAPAPENEFDQITQKQADALSQWQKDKKTADDIRASFYANKKKQKLPKNAAALAEFAANARVPNQTLDYIAPKTANTANTNQDAVNPNQFENYVDNNSINASKDAVNGSTVNSTIKPNAQSKSNNLVTVTETEKQKAQALVLAQINALPTSSAQITKNETVKQFPALSATERADIVAEIKKTDPTVDAIDPLDGEIKLEALQTAQSVLAAQGKQKRITFNQNLPRQDDGRPKGKRIVYRVKQGDSLLKIANRYGLYWRDIAEWNQVDPSASLYVGTPLYLYAVKKQPKSEPKPTSYRVQSGDTMIGVASKYGMSASQLARLNNMRALDDLRIGQTLKLTKSHKASKAQTPKQILALQQKQKAKPSRQKTKTYQVKRGDGLIGLAKRFGMTTQALASLNGLNVRDNLQLGQRLKVPADVNLASKTSKPTSHRVKAGDTMIGVASRYGMSASQLARLNDLRALDELRIGQILTLTASKQTKKASKANQTKKSKPIRYRVKAGDTMIGVAAKNGMSARQLARLNNMKPLDNLILGQTLTLVKNKHANKTAQKSSRKNAKKSSKKQGKRPTSYVVESGDTMIYVANKFGLSPSRLAKINGLKTMDGLVIGKRLTLVDKQTNKLSKKSRNKNSNKKDKSKKQGYKKYRVQAGDGLIALARKYGISTVKLAKLNNIKPTTSLKLGQLIKVPR